MVKRYTHWNQNLKDEVVIQLLMLRFAPEVEICRVHFGLPSSPRIFLLFINGLSHQSITIFALFSLHCISINYTRYNRWKLLKKSSIMLLRVSRLAGGDVSSLRPLTQPISLVGPLYIQSRNAGGPNTQKRPKGYAAKIARKRIKKALLTGTKSFTAKELRRAVKMEERDASEKVAKQTNRQIKRAAMNDAAASESTPSGGHSRPSAIIDFKEHEKENSRPSTRETASKDYERGNSRIPAREQAWSGFRNLKPPDREQQFKTTQSPEVERPRIPLFPHNPYYKSDKSEESRDRRPEESRDRRPGNFETDKYTSSRSNVSALKSGQPQGDLRRSGLAPKRSERGPSPSPVSRVEDASAGALPLDGIESAVNEMLSSSDSAQDTDHANDKARRVQDAIAARTKNLDEAELLAIEHDIEVERNQILKHGPKSMLHKRSPHALLTKPLNPSRLASPKQRRAKYARAEPRIDKVIFSGIQPTGIPHLGNYLGALRGWVKLQNEADASTRLIYSLVDLHAMTVRQDPAELRRQRQESFAMLMAIGLDPHRSILFHQSDVSAHAELMWILSCQASTGYLGRMTQWKDKTSNESEDSGKLKLGLFSYPVLQAADILLYQTTHVPVGEDQAQHLEFARDLANSFNHHYGSKHLPVVLNPPKTIISSSKRIRSLADPTLKMSKSHPNEKSRILLNDDEDVIRSKVKVAVTDSIETGITYDPENRPGISNLINLLYYASPDYQDLEIRIGDPEKVFAEQPEPSSDESTEPTESTESTETTETTEPTAPQLSPHEAAELAAKIALAADLTDLSKKAFKDHVADTLENTIRPIRERYAELVGNPALLEMEAELGARKAKERADFVLSRVKHAVGLR
jgi:tryptophanyl-tRNA synthetase